MSDITIWVGDDECLLDKGGSSYVVTDPRLVSSIRRWAREGARLSEVRSSRSPAATTMASLSEVANARPYSDERPSATWLRPSGVLPQRLSTPLPEVSFAKVLESRRSLREFEAPTNADLLGLLTNSARSRFAWTTDDGTTVTSRPSPSAGARHPLEIVVAAQSVRGLDPGLYWFDPVLCRLAPLTSDDDEAQRLAIKAQIPLATDSPPPVVIYLIAELERTLTRYRGGFSLVLRDAGALIATICLVATALDLAACPLGTGGDSPALDALGVSYPEWAQVGAIALGSIEVP